MPLRIATGSSAAPCGALAGCADFAGGEDLAPCAALARLPNVAASAPVRPERTTSRRVIMRFLLKDLLFITPALSGQNRLRRIRLPLPLTNGLESASSFVEEARRVQSTFQK